MRILHRSSLAIFDCLMSDTAVTSVSIALAKSPVKMLLLLVIFNKKKKKKKQKKKNQHARSVFWVYFGF